jgi:hypothetical protein
MLKHGISLGVFTLLTAFATPGAAYQTQTRWDDREVCGCVLREWLAPSQDGRAGNGRQAERRQRMPADTAAQ